jgi:hypothetical protein
MWSDHDVDEFRETIANFYGLNGNTHYVEVASITPELDQWMHRIMSQSVVRWRLINLGYGVKRQSAELLVLLTMKPPTFVQFEDFIIGSHFPLLRGSTMVAPPDPTRAKCRMCIPNPDTAYSLIAPPFLCIYTVSGLDEYAYSFDPLLATTGCPQ